MTPDEALGRAFEQARWDSRISQTVMANKMNISQPTLSRKLKGERPWTFAEMIKAADALRIDVRTVLTNMWGPGAADLPATAGELPRLDSNQQPFDYQANGVVTYLQGYRARRLRRAS